MIIPLFYLFAAMMIAGGVMVVSMANPVSSALSMVLSFIGLAGLFIGLNAYFIGILQVLVYAGAIMVLFIFIIMLLDLKKEETHPRKGIIIAAGVLIPIVLLVQLAGVLTTRMNSPEAPKLALEKAASDYDEKTVIHKKLAANSLPDIHLIGRKLFTEYNFPLQVIAVLLLVATVGCVVLSRKSPAIITRQPTKKHIPTIISELESESDIVLGKLAGQKTGLTPAGNSFPDEKRALIHISRPGDADDLKIIPDVDSMLEGKLNNSGIYTYQQVANLSEAKITEFDDLISLKGRITPDN